MAGDKSMMETRNNTRAFLKANFNLKLDICQPPQDPRNDPTFRDQLPGLLQSLITVSGTLQQRTPASRWLGMIKTLVDGINADKSVSKLGSLADMYADEARKVMDQILEDTANELEAATKDVSKSPDTFAEHAQSLVAGMGKSFEAQMPTGFPANMIAAALDTYDAEALQIVSSMADRHRQNCIIHETRQELRRSITDKIAADLALQQSAKEQRAAEAIQACKNKCDQDLTQLASDTRLLPENFEAKSNHAVGANRDSLGAVLDKIFAEPPHSNCDEELKAAIAKQSILDRALAAAQLSNDELTAERVTVHIDVDKAQKLLADQEAAMLTVVLKQAGVPYDIPGAGDELATRLDQVQKERRALEDKWIGTQIDAEIVDDKQEGKDMLEARLKKKGDTLIGTTKVLGKIFRARAEADALSAKIQIQDAKAALKAASESVLRLDASLEEASAHLQKVRVDTHAKQEAVEKLALEKQVWDEKRAITQDATARADNQTGQFLSNFDKEVIRVKNNAKLRYAENRQAAADQKREKEAAEEAKRQQKAAEAKALKEEQKRKEVEEQRIKDEIRHNVDRAEDKAEEHAREAGRQLERLAERLDVALSRFDTKAKEITISWRRKLTVLLKDMTSKQSVFESSRHSAAIKTYDTKVHKLTQVHKKDHRRNHLRNDIDNLNRDVNSRLSQIQTLESQVRSCESGLQSKDHEGEIRVESRNYNNGNSTVFSCAHISDSHNPGYPCRATRPGRCHTFNQWTTSRGCNWKGNSMTNGRVQGSVLVYAKSCDVYSSTISTLNLQKSSKNASISTKRSQISTLRQRISSKKTELASV